MREISRRRVTTRAMGAEVCLTSLRITRDYIENLIFHAVCSRLIARQEKDGNIVDLTIIEVAERGHALCGAAMENYRADFLAGAFVVQHEDRPNEIRTTIAPVSVTPVAEG